LSQLRDFIKCPVDHMIPDDVSKEPFSVSVNPSTGHPAYCWDEKKRNKDLYKSGFLFIEGCFYNDMRCRKHCEPMPCRAGAVMSRVTG
jgi:hypothetical protein